MNKAFSIISTIAIFTTIVSAGISPVVAVTPKPSATPFEEDFTVSPTPKTTTKATESSKATSKPAVLAATATPSATNTDKQKMAVYKGVVSATPSAIGKFLVKTDSGDKNVDSDKSTKVFLYTDKGPKQTSTVSKLKVGNPVIVIGTPTLEGNALFAKFVLVNPVDHSNKTSTGLYGLVDSREASGTAFIITVKSPNKDDKINVVLNAETSVKVKDLEDPKLSDVKIGDRVTLTYYKDEKTGINFVTRIFVVPGRAAGLLRDIRDASAAAEKKDKEDQTLKSTPKPSASSSATPKATTRSVLGAQTTASPKTTTKPTATPN